MGVKITTITKGDGKTYPKPGDTVKLHYIGSLESTGKKFDSSYDRGHAFQTKIGTGSVIRGWEEAIPQLTLGQRAIIEIPGSDAYGEKGFPGLIPPNSTLIVSEKQRGTDLVLMFL